MVRDYHRSAAENVGIGADAGDAAVTGSAFRAVAPVSAVYAAFRVQPSAYPPRATKPDVAPTCGGVAETANAEEASLQAAFGRGRSRKRRSRIKGWRRNRRFSCSQQPAVRTVSRGCAGAAIGACLEKITRGWHQESRKRRRFKGFRRASAQNGGL